MTDNQPPKSSQIQVHLVGGLVCALIAGASIYFAGTAISKRRGVFLNARHELASKKSMLNDSASQRATLAGRIRSIEKQSSHQIELFSAKELNSRTAEIVKLAESVEIQIDSLQPNNRIDDARVPVQPLILTGNSTADQVFAFIELIGDRMPDIHIQGIDIVNGALETPEVHISMELYWFVDPASQG